MTRPSLRTGQQCFQFLADTMQNLKTTDIQVDEVWSYVGCKERTAFFQNAGEGVGDAYVFTALDRNTKLLFCFHVGRRSAEDANLFANKLALCVSDSIRPHVSTDGYNPYHVAIPQAFGHNVDHGMLVKQYASPTGKGQQRYSPASIIGAKEYQNLASSGQFGRCCDHSDRSLLKQNLIEPQRHDGHDVGQEFCLILRRARRAVVVHSALAPLAKSEAQLGQQRTLSP